ncbi:MAG TPA: hypothetical protein VK421_12650 [Pyrinomonadaceae bacterium]|nr:hypothetical protein [Pyrinomonadaceae bacterium]
MPREVIGADGISWSCVEAYAGLSDDNGGAAAERAAAGSGRPTVVCTPSGGAKSVRLELTADWEKSLGDEQLLREIESHRET